MPRAVSARGFFDGALTHLRIRSLRGHGIEGAEKTVAAEHRWGAALAPLRKGSCQRKLTEGSFLRSKPEQTIPPAFALLKPLPWRQFALTHLLIHLLRWRGNDYSDETITSGRALLATAVGAIRLWIVPIRLLQCHGYESADKTAAVRHRDTAVNSSAVISSALPATAVACLPLEGKVGRSEAESRMRCLNPHYKVLNHLISHLR